MDPVSATASVITCYQLASVVTTHCFCYLKGVKEAFQDGDLLIARIEVFQKSLCSLQRLLAEEKSSPLEAGRLHYLEDIMLGNSMLLDRCSQELEKTKKKLIKAQSGMQSKRLFHRLSWPLKREEVEQLFQSMEGFVSAIDRALDFDTNEVIRGIDSKAIDIDSTTKRILFSTRSIESRQSKEESIRKEHEEWLEVKEKREDILAWLVHPDPSENHAVASKVRKFSQTGRWFLDGLAFKEFKQTPRSILWLHGDSGSGKTVLFSAIIDELRASCYHESDGSEAALAYWYFSIHDARKRSLESLVRALITQLIPINLIPSTLVGLWKARRESRDAPVTSDLLYHLGAILEQALIGGCFKAFYIMLDALDESQGTENAVILAMLKQLVSIDTIDIRVLVTGRGNTSHVEQGLLGIANISHISMDRMNADEDIKVYIDQSLLCD